MSVEANHCLEDHSSYTIPFVPGELKRSCNNFFISFKTPDCRTTSGVQSKLRKQGVLWWLCKILRYDSSNQDEQRIQVDMCPKTHCFPPSHLFYYTVFILRTVWPYIYIRILHNTVGYQREFHKNNKIFPLVIFNMQVK